MREDDGLAERFALKLKGAVADTGLTKTEISSRAGIAPEQLSRYLQGKTLPSARVLASLAQTLGASADFLLGMKASESERDALERRLMRAWGGLPYSDREEVVRFAEWRLDLAKQKIRRPQPGK